jgi:uncharacterized protein (AIM24 family)
VANIPIERTYTCDWCNTVSNGTQLSCPGCGISIDVRKTVTKSGWIEMPGRHDMAKIQFGNSYLQIEGEYVPVADFALSQGDGVYFTHHVLLWMEPQVKVTTMSLKGAWKRLFAGMPLIMTQAEGPGHIAFSQDQSGEVIALPIQPGAAIDVREHIFLAATSNVTYDWFSTNVWYTTRNGNERETHYPLGMFMDRFFAPQTPGLLLLHAAGNAFIRHLAPNETILVKPTALLFKDPSVQMHLHLEYPRGGNFSWGIFSTWYYRHIWLRLHGPGRVAVQSAYKHMEENGRNIVNYSPATQAQW